MIRNGRCTIYSYSDADDAYIRKIYRSYNYLAHSVTGGKGFSADCDALTARIPCKPEVNKGDKIVPRICCDDVPPADSFKIVEIHENFYGYNQHVRIEARR